MAARVARSTSRTRAASPVKEVIAAAGRAVPHEPAARRPGDPPVLIGDASRARALLGWQPARSFGDAHRRRLEMDAGAAIGLIGVQCCAEAC
jgi:UDP-glucose 4-epimerase